VFLQALIEYANLHLSHQAEEDAWEERRVHYLLEISPTGEFLGLLAHVSRSMTGNQDLFVPKNLMMPRSPVLRTRGINPLLAADNTRYVLGAGAWTKPGEYKKHTQRHRAFVKLIVKAAKAIHDSSLEACARFYARPDQVKKAREAARNVKSGALLALSVDGPVIAKPQVRSYWNGHYGKQSSKRAESGFEGDCLICGGAGGILPTHDKIRGASNLGGRATGVSLVSFSKDAFQSYGWQTNQNSPLCSHCSNQYVLALNDLLRPGTPHRTNVAGLGVLFWQKRERQFGIFEYLELPDWKRAQDLFGAESHTNAGTDTFYLLVVSANGGRLCVRYWASGNTLELRRNVGEWYMGLRLSDRGYEPTPPSFWKLLRVIHRQGAPPASRTVSLLRRAIEGQAKPLGAQILTDALSPLQHGVRVSPERLGLVRLCLNDLRYARGDERKISEGLDPEETAPGYLCGRLFAEYESVRAAALRKLGKLEVSPSLFVKHYAQAAACPAIAFPRIHVLLRKDLRILKRWNRDVIIANERRIEQLQRLVKRTSRGFPIVLDLEQRALFALGYYHQQADLISRALAKGKKIFAGGTDFQVQADE